MPAAEAIRWYGDDVTVRFWYDHHEERVSERAAQGLMSRGVAYIVPVEEPLDGVEKETEEVEDLIGTLAPEQEPAEIPKAPQPKPVVSTRKGASVKNESQPTTE